MIRQRIVLDLETEPVTLQEAKDWLSMDFNDFDDMIAMLIKSARLTSEQVSGHAYGVKIFEVTGNQRGEKVYTAEPFIEDVEWEGENGVKDYRYKAGFVTLPENLREQVLRRMATSFSYRQNIVDVPISKTFQSPSVEFGYKYMGP